MSIEAMVWVFDLEGEHAPKLGTRLVLLALADNAGAKATFEDAHVGWPSIARLARKAQISERQTQRAIKELKEAGFITCVGELESGVRQWRLNLEKRCRAGGGDKLSGVTPVSPGGDVGVTQNPKEPQGEANASRSVPDSKSYLEPRTPGSAAAPWLVIELARLMRSNDPRAVLPVGLRELMAPEYAEHYGTGFASPDERRKLIASVAGKPALRKWLDAMRLLIDADERPAKEAVKVLRWCQEDDFWKSNILSAPTFRKQYPKLRLRWLEEGGDDRPGSAPADRRPSTAAQLDAMTRRSTE